MPHSPPSHARMRGLQERGLLEFREALTGIEERRCFTV